MADYISREAAIEAAEKYGLGNGTVLGAHSGIADCIAGALESLHAADVAPVRHGQWLTWEEMFPGETPKKKNNLGVFCGVCKNHADNMSGFCPNCGSKMDGGAKDEPPTVDAVLVVRCKDCKYHRELNDNECEYLQPDVLICTNAEFVDDGWNPVWPDDFCSYGERRKPNEK